MEAEDVTASKVDNHLAFHPKIEVRQFVLFEFSNRLDLKLAWKVPIDKPFLIAH